MKVKLKQENKKGGKQETVQRLQRQRNKAKRMKRNECQEKVEERRSYASVLV